MVGGLAGIAVGATIAGLSTGHRRVRRRAAACSPLAKIVFDVGLISWTADHVPTSGAAGSSDHRDVVGARAARRRHARSGSSPRRRRGAGRTSSAPSPSSPRPGVRARPARRRTSRRRGRRAPAGRRRTTRLRPSGWAAVVGMFGLMAAAQALFVTFGAWLEDDFGVRHGRPRRRDVRDRRPRAGWRRSTSAARTDRWGKERSVMRGAAIMVPVRPACSPRSTSSSASGSSPSASFIAAFEFAIVSAIPIGAELVPGAPGRGIGTMIACGTRRAGGRRRSRRRGCTSASAWRRAAMLGAGVRRGRRRRPCSPVGASSPPRPRRRSVGSASVRKVVTASFGSLSELARRRGARPRAGAGPGRHRRRGRRRQLRRRADRRGPLPGHAAAAVHAGIRGRRRRRRGRRRRRRARRRRRVLALPSSGGYASQVAVPAPAAVPIPDNLTAGQAAGLVQSYATMLYALHPPDDRHQPASGSPCSAPAAASGWPPSTWRPRSAPRSLHAHRATDKLTLARRPAPSATVAYEADGVDLKTAIREVDRRRRRRRRRPDRRAEGRGGAAQPALGRALPRGRVRRPGRSRASR